MMSVKTLQVKEELLTMTAERDSGRQEALRVSAAEETTTQQLSILEDVFTVVCAEKEALQRSCHAIRQELVCAMADITEKTTHMQDMPITLQNATARLDKMNQGQQELRERVLTADQDSLLSQSKVDFLEQTLSATSRRLQVTQVQVARLDAQLGQGVAVECSLQEELQMSRTCNDALSNSLVMLQDRMSVSLPQATLTSLESASQHVPPFCWHTCERGIDAIDSCNHRTHAACDLNQGSATKAMADKDGSAHVHDQLLMRMQHQIQRPLYDPALFSPAPSSAAAMAGAAARGRHGEGHDQIPSSAAAMAEEVEHTRSMSFNGTTHTVCTGTDCKLNLEMARREIDALDHTVGALIVEIMDMLMAASAFHKDQVQVFVSAFFVLSDSLALCVLVSSCVYPLRLPLSLSFSLSLPSRVSQREREGG